MERARDDSFGGTHARGLRQKLLRWPVLALFGGAACLCAAACAPDFDKLTQHLDCANGVQDDAETDVDCGGSCIAAGQPCDDGKKCKRSSDCAEGRACTAGVCAEPDTGDRCVNNKRDSGETDVDCGGTCAPTRLCGLGRACAASSDCGTGVCSKKDLVCVAPSCSDGVRNQEESDVDCGGGCAKCEVESKCVSGDDCKSGVCSSRVCRAPSCNDRIQSLPLGETDVDCGGECATKAEGYLRCGRDQNCKTASDCQEFVCEAASARCKAPPALPSVSELIADFEDDTMVIANTDGRQGIFYQFGDGTGPISVSVEAIDGNRMNSTSCAHLVGTGLKVWGGGMGLDLNNPTTQTNTKKPWDASAYTGVAFWAKTNTKTSISILVAFPSTQTDPTGGNCDPSPGAEKIEKCDDHFAASVLLGTDWSYFKLPFSKTAQTGWGKPYAALDVTSLLGLQWRLGANTDFDFVVDDIQFYVE